MANPCPSMPDGSIFRDPSTVEPHLTPLLRTDNKHRHRYGMSVVELNGKERLGRFDEAHSSNVCLTSSMKSGGLALFFCGAALLAAGTTPVAAIAGGVTAVGGAVIASLSGCVASERQHKRTQITQQVWKESVAITEAYWNTL